MTIRERFQTGYKKLEAIAGKYLLPQELRAVLIFLVIGVSVVLFRGGRFVWQSLFPPSPDTESVIASRKTDSIFATLSSRSDMLHFWTAPDSAGGDEPAAKKDEAQAIAPASLALNRASQTELEQLPGIGEVMSKRILDYRRLHGRFGSLDELMNVAGIGQKKFEKIKPYLRLD